MEQRCLIFKVNGEEILIPEDLLISMIKGELVVIGGNGISIEALGDFPEILESVGKTLNISPDGNNARERLSDLLKKVNNDNIVKKAFIEEVRRRENEPVNGGTFPTETHHALTKISRKFITTNYDRGLSIALEKKTHKKITEIPYPLTKLLPLIDNEIAYIHGIEHKHIILTDDDFHSRYLEYGLHELIRLIGKNTVLFIGTSLDDKYLQDMAQIRNTSFFILKQNSEQEHIRLLQKRGFEVITYDKHAILPTLCDAIHFLFFEPPATTWPSLSDKQKCWMLLKHPAKIKYRKHCFEDKGGDLELFDWAWENNIIQTITKSDANCDIFCTWLSHENYLTDREEKILNLLRVYPDRYLYSPDIERFEPLLDLKILHTLRVVGKKINILPWYDVIPPNTQYVPCLLAQNAKVQKSLLPKIFRKPGFVTKVMDYCQYDKEKFIQSITALPQLEEQKIRKILENSNDPQPRDFLTLLNAQAIEA